MEKFIRKMKEVENFLRFNFLVNFPSKNSDKNSLEFNYNKKAIKCFDKYKFCRCSNEFKKIYNDMNTNNKLLFLENLHLRKQLMITRAMNICANEPRGIYKLKSK